jgi:hypothetical protein
MLPPLPRCSRWAHSSLKITHPCQPSPIPLSGRPAHRPFRGLLGVYSRCGLHTCALTLVTTIRGLQTFRHLHACPGCFRRERSPGGPCTHWKSAALSRRTWKAVPHLDPSWQPGCAVSVPSSPNPERGGSILSTARQDSTANSPFLGRLHGAAWHWEAYNRPVLKAREVRKGCRRFPDEPETLNENMGMDVGCVPSLSHHECDFNSRRIGIHWASIWR